MKFKSYTLSGPLQGDFKTYALLGKTSSCMTPLMYMRKPKWMPENTFKELMKRMMITIPDDFKFEDDK